MCGINGIFHFQKSNPFVGELEKMNKELAHRGPDAEGIFRENEIELGTSQTFYN
jgi:asparagine synthetase B (glutamine-hydrolysing)